MLAVLGVEPHLVGGDIGPEEGRDELSPGPEVTHHPPHLQPLRPQARLLRQLPWPPPASRSPPAGSCPRGSTRAPSQGRYSSSGAAASPVDGQDVDAGNGHPPPDLLVELLLDPALSHLNTRLYLRGDG